MREFSLDDLDQDIEAVDRDVICDVILSFARLDSLVSQLVLLAFGLAYDGGTILLGSMDTRTKLDRLKKLYDHHGMKKAAQSIANLRQHHKEHVDIRNSISHHTCAGRWKSRPDMIVFAPVRAVHGKPNFMEVEHIPLSAMRRAAIFAREAGNALITVTDAVAARTAIQPPEPPVFRPPSPPSPQKSGGKGRSPQRKA